MRKKYIVKLSQDEKEQLRKLVASGTHSARKLNRARVLLKTDEGWSDGSIVTALDVSRPTVERIRRRFVLEGFEAALNQRSPRRTYERRLDGDAEARLIALACSSPPEGRSRWTMRLLADKLVVLEEVDIDSVSYETVRQVLKKRTKTVVEKAVGNSTDPKL
jgi:transposase